MVIRIFSKKRDRLTAAASKKKDKSDGDKRIYTTDFHLVEARLNEMGFYRQHWETVTAWIDRLEASPNMTGDIDILRQLNKIYYRRRFNPATFTPADGIQMSRLAREWLDASQ